MYIIIEYRNPLAYNEWMHFYTRHKKVDKVRELYEEAMNSREYLIRPQPEYFYRAYIMFILDNNLNCQLAIQCFSSHKSEMLDPVLRNFLQRQLEIATCCFNNPDGMLEDVELFYKESLLPEFEYRREKLVINMLSLRLQEAERQVYPDHVQNPLLMTREEQILYIWMTGAEVEYCPHWHSMASYGIKEINCVYQKELWRSDVQDVLRRYGTGEKREIVIDLWALYYLLRNNMHWILDSFRIVYLTHSTLSYAVLERYHTNDILIRNILKILFLITCQNARGNIVWRSPALNEQLVGRDAQEIYHEHVCCLTLAEIMDCPALIGEHRYPIPERFRCRTIRPNEAGEMAEWLKQP